MWKFLGQLTGVERMEGEVEETGTQHGVSGYNRDAGEQVEGGKAASTETGGGVWREWKFFQVYR